MRIAIVGGGFTGCCAAATLSAYFRNHPTIQLEIVLFDMGGRGVGGRSSHRRVRHRDGKVLSDDLPPEDEDGETMEFDHGAQFFRACSPSMKQLTQHWVENQWAAEWQGQFGKIAANGGMDYSLNELVDQGSDDFFGCPPPPGEALITGVGGMHTICRKIMEHDAPEVKVCRGVRVARVERILPGDVNGADIGGSDRGVTRLSSSYEECRWRLHGTGGRAALHDTPEAELVGLAAAELAPIDTGDFNLVLMTDVSSSFGTWHRASAGLQEDTKIAPLARRVGSRVRVPLFSAMVAFRRVTDNERTAPEKLPGVAKRETASPLDAFTVVGSDTLWFAARNNSKPFSAVAVPAKSTNLECWTLVSTAAFACSEIEETCMQDPNTGAFRAQDPNYLNGSNGPTRKLLAEFRRIIATQISASSSSSASSTVNSSYFYADESLAYIAGQRWGSALPQPVARTRQLEKEESGSSKSEAIKNIMGVTYDATPGGFAPPQRVASVEPGQQLTQIKSQPNPYLAAAATSGMERNNLSPSETGAGEFGPEIEEEASLGFFYAGDFCSYNLVRNPGIEAASLSGIAAAAHMASIVVALSQN